MKEEGIEGFIFWFHKNLRKLMQNYIYLLSLHVLVNKVDHWKFSSELKQNKADWKVCVCVWGGGGGGGGAESN